jgi:hypothetical protein
VRVALLAVIVIALLVGGRPAEALRHPSAPRCSIFPKSNVWNRRVDRLPVAANSDAIIRSIGPDETLHPDFGSGLWEGAPIGIPITVVRGRQAKTRVRFEYADESDRGPYPIPRNVKIEGGRQSDGDRHALILDRDNCRLYELFALYPEGSGWRAGSGAIWNLRTNRLRPAGWTSADAAGLPIFPGLARFDEVARGRIAGHPQSAAGPARPGTRRLAGTAGRRPNPAPIGAPAAGRTGAWPPRPAPAVPNAVRRPSW